ncbi:MAG: hypothetical protein GY788_26930 [bacterium]|nr:hypothetical protein [bacterium]
MEPTVLEAEPPKPWKRKRLEMRKVSDLPEPPRAKWHAVHTKARSEELVNLLLRERGWWTFYPQRLATVTHARKTDEVLRPYLPRYVFLSALPHQDVFDVNELPGVSTVLWSADGPLVINDREIAVMQARADRNGVIPEEAAKDTPRIVFEPGTKLVVTQGPFTHFEGEVIAMETSAGAPYVALALQFLGGPTKASLPIGWVAAV